MILVTKTGGCGGFFASVRETGVTGQQQQASTVSAEFTVRGGAGGGFISRGGGTNPFSSEPSPARTVPRQNVASKALFTATEFLNFVIFGRIVELALQAILALLKGANQIRMHALRKTLLAATAALLVLLPATLPAQGAKELYGNDIYWNATPNDVNNLLKSMKDQVDANFQMDARPMSQVSTDPEQNPVLFRSGHYNFSYSPEEREKLREYLLNGGMIIFNTGLGSAPFYNSVVRELKEIFPEQPLQRLTSDHPIFHSYYDVDRVEYNKAVKDAGYTGNEPWFEAVEINCRVVALVSRWCMAVGWQGETQDDWQAYKPESAFQLGVNIFNYASAMRAWAKNAAQAMKFTDKLKSYSDTISLAQIVYDGVWKTRHSGLSVMLQTFNARTGVPVKFALKELRANDPAIFDSPVLYLTGHEHFTMNAEEKSALKEYIENGGLLFAESCCGRKGFDLAFRELVQSMFPDKKLERVPPGSVLFKQPNDIQSVGVTEGLMQEGGQAKTQPTLLAMDFSGHYGIIYSPYGLAGGWEMSQSPYSRGINDVGAVQIGQNVLMYSLTN